MQAQIDFCKTEEFEDFVAGLGSLEEAETIIHGIFVELHPTWRALYDEERLLKAGVVDPNYLRWKFTDFPPIMTSSFPERYLIERQISRYDTKEKPKGWEEHAEGKPPFLVKVYVEPTVGTRAGLREAVESYVDQQAFFCLVIDAPIPTFVNRVNAAADMQATLNGTLGGFVQDQNYRILGVTCAHVAQVPGGPVTLNDAGGARRPNAASVVETNYNSFSPLGSSGSCNPYRAQNPPPNVDLALIELNGSFNPSNFTPNIGVVDRHLDKTQLNSGDQLVHQGAMTGPNTYEIGGYGYMTKIESGGISYCFSDVFDFAKITTNRFQRGFASLPVQGDSGSWLVHDEGADKSFFGMLVAVRQARGIGVFATSVFDYAKQPPVSLDLNVY